MRVSLWILASALLIAGCGKAESSDASAAESFKADAPMADAAKAGFAAPAETLAGRGGENAPMKLASNEAPAMPRLVIRNADLTLRVKDIKSGESAVGAVARRVGGLIEASQGADLAGPSPTLSVTLRVPEARFEETVAALEGLGTRLGKTIGTEDVTAQAVDLEARLKSLRVQEDAYRAILGAARKIGDVLEVQERLTGVRTQIEEIVAQRRTLGDQAARSKITVNLTQALTPATPGPEPDWLAQTWGDATGALRAFGRSLASFGLWAVAMLPIWLPLALVAAWLFRGRRAKTV